MKKTDKTFDKVVNLFMKENLLFTVIVAILKILAPVVIIVFLGLTLFSDFDYWKHTVFSMVLYFPFIYILKITASIIVERWSKRNRDKIEKQVIDDMLESKESFIKFMEELRAETLKNRQDEEK